MRQILVPLFLIMVSGACVQDFQFEQDSTDEWLVIEGYISDSPGDHAILLSWSNRFADRTTNHISNASVRVIENGSVIIPFNQEREGKYVPDDPSFVALSDRSYRLEIELEDGRLVQSDILFLQHSPEISSISYQPVSTFIPGEQKERKELSLLVSNQGDSKSSGFYRYEIDETYLHIAPYAFGDVFKFQFYRDLAGRAVYVKSIDTLLYNTPNRICWLSDTVRGINIASSQDYVGGILSKAPIHSIPLDETKLLYRYSALVHQFAIDETAYNFYRLVTSFSEEEGLLFSKQPDRVDGNVFSVNNDLKVIGLFQVSGKRSKRTYIDFDELPDDVQIELGSANLNCEFNYFMFPVYDNCQIELLETPNQQLSAEEAAAKNSLESITRPVFSALDSLQSERQHWIVKQTVTQDIACFAERIEGEVISVKPVCADCGSFDGLTKKPEWWID